MSCKRYHIIFSTFSLKFKCKICVRKEVIHNFKNHELRTTSYELTHFKKMVRAWKAKSLLFCLRYDPLIVFGRQNHITFIFIKTMSRDPLVQMAYSKFPTSIPTTFICGVPPPPPGGGWLTICSFLVSCGATPKLLNSTRATFYQSGLYKFFPYWLSLSLSLSLPLPPPPSLSLVSSVRICYVFSFGKI